jgi:hypothetical protein
MTAPADSPRARARARDLAALADYVRALADRMGLEGRTFEVDSRRPTGEVVLFAHVVGDDPATTRIFVEDSFFGRGPEERRREIVRQLVRAKLHDGADAIAAAWAASLPLPLVGLMRRAEARP